MKKIGVVEGYYGEISKFDDRKKIIESLNKYNLNFYLYAPKEDPFLRSHLDIEYTKEWLSAFRSFVNFSTDLSVDIGVGLSLVKTAHLSGLKEKIKIFIGQKKHNLRNVTIVVVSSAIKKNNPEMIEAKRKNLPVITRGEMLAHIVSLTKNIVIAGSHGKTTTTSLVSSIFQRSKLDPTIINGGVINSIKNTAKLGKSDWSILEADESDGSFVHIPPTYSIITNIDLSLIHI